MAGALGVSSAVGAITGYTQTQVFQTSGRITPPNGTKRIEALMCGGGGGGGTSAGGGGFGGLQIYNIPVTGLPLDYTVGAGGAANTAGGTTSVSSAGTMYAAVGGGGGGSTGGKYGGGGSGHLSTGGVGGAPFCAANLLWSALDSATPRSGNTPGTFFSLDGTTYQRAVLGHPSTVGGTSGSSGTDPVLGWGGSGGGRYVPSSYGIGLSGGAGAGGGYSSGTGAGAFAGGNGGAGAGGGHTTESPNPGPPGNGGALTSVSIWGMTGFADGAKAATATNAGAGSGGGMLSAGTAASGTTGGNGGNGGGGGGGGGTGGTGGNGFIMFRFYY